MGKIYQIKNLINNKKYIGQTISSITIRFNKHVHNSSNKTNDCPLLEEAIDIYGKDNFEVIILLRCNKEYLDYYESKFIYMHNTSFPNGYNLMSGGQGSIRRHSIITKRKMTKTRIGKTHTNITKQKISNSHKNKIVSNITRQKQSLSKKGSYKNKKNKDIVDSFLKKYKIDKLPIYVCLVKPRKKYGFQVNFPKYLNLKNKKVAKYNDLKKNYDKLMEYYNLYLTDIGLQ